MMQTYRLPPAFYFDHRERDLPERGTSTVVRQGRTRVVVAMDEAAYADLLSDADHYATNQGWENHLRGLRLSARATAIALRTQGAPGTC